MSIQMNLVFLVLVAELAILAILVAPLPQVVRSKLVKLSTYVMGHVHYQVITIFSGLLVGLMFLDSLNKLTRGKQLLTHTQLGVVAPVLSSELLLRVFYAQRNMYLTGAVLFFGLAIGTVVMLLKQLVRAQERLLAATTGNASSVSEEDLAEIADLKSSLEKHQVDKQALQKQVDGMGRAYDALVEPTVVTGDKKLE